MRTNRRRFLHKFLKLTAGAAAFATVPFQAMASRGAQDTRPTTGIDDADKIVLVTLVIPYEMSGDALCGNLPRDTLYTSHFVSKDDLIDPKEMERIGGGSGVALYRSFTERRFPGIWDTTENIKKYWQHGVPKNTRP